MPFAEKVSVQEVFRRVFHLKIQWFLYGNHTMGDAIIYKPVGSLSRVFHFVGRFWKPRIRHRLWQRENRQYPNCFPLLTG